MWRSNSSLRPHPDHWKEHKITGNDIIQLYSKESKAAKERNKKITEIQRRARRKDAPGNVSSETQTKTRIETRKNSKQARQTGYSRTKLPAIEITSKPTKTNRRRSSGRDEHFLPDINMNVNRARPRHVHVAPSSFRNTEPARDPRFQNLLACLLTADEYFGDLQRFAPPRMEKNRRTRIGLGF